VGIRSNTPIKYGTRNLVILLFANSGKGFFKPKIAEAPDRKKNRGIIQIFTNPRKKRTDSLVCGLFTCQ